MSEPLRKIVCPVDFSEQSEHALAQAAELAAQSGADLLLLTVVQPMPAVFPGENALMTQLHPVPLTFKDEAAAQLASMRDKFCGAVLERTTSSVAIGVPFVEIVRFAREHEADLIVMGSHGRTGLEHLMIGSVAERVVRKAPCSVLVVRNKERKFVMP